MKSPVHCCQLALAAAAAVYLFTGHAQAAPIAVGNHSFENQVTNLNAGQWTNQLIDWTGTNGNNDANAFEEYINGFAAQGTDHLGMALNYDVWQDLGLTYQANTVYTLTVATGHRGGTTMAGNQSTYILAATDGSIYATGVKDAFTQPANSFQDAPALVFDTASNASSVGKNIRILLRARGVNRSHFDNIRLDGPVDTRAAVSTSAASAITTSSAQLNGTVTNIGGGAPTVTIYYGPSDGGTSKAAWAQSVALPGTQTAGFSHVVTGLTGNTTYFYRALAANSGGEAWSSPATSFVTSAGPPLVDNLAVTGLTASGARLGVTVLETGGEAPTVTIYYGTTDGGTTPANWAASTVLGVVGSTASADVTGLIESTAYFFRAFGQNSSGGAWAPASGTFMTLNASLASVINRPASDVTHYSARLRGSVTATGGDPPMATIYWGTTDGGTNPAGWQNAAPQGFQANDFSEDVAGLTAGTTYYFRSAATNGGGIAWAPSSESFATPATSVASIQHLPTTGITSTTANLHGEVVNDGGSPVTITFYWGTTDGGTVAGNWQNVAHSGVQSGGFSRFIGGLSPNTTYYFRAFAANGSGSVWAAQSDSFTTRSTTPTNVVINELHYQRPNNDTTKRNQPGEFLPATELIEFIELHNPTAAAIDVSGWRLSDGVDFLIPAGTTIAANGFLLIAQDPADLAARFGVTGLGPWEGNLRAEGERVELRNAGGQIVDEVSYEAGFPWPTAARGAGESAERIHWSLDPDLGGSWRSSQFSARSFFSLASTQWRWRKGTSEPSAAVGAWRSWGTDAAGQASEEDAGWQTGTSPFGFGVVGATVNTALPDMRQTAVPPVPGYSCIYLRHSFDVGSNIPGQLQVSGPIDDGAVFWINGSEVARFNVTVENPPFTGVASNPGSHLVTRNLTINNAASYLHPGVNVLAVQAFNVLINNSDFYFDAELRLPVPPPGSGAPTPGATNSQFATTAPPAVREVTHVPNQPTAGQDVVVTAKVTDPDGVASVSLKYQTVNPGSYVPRRLVNSVTGAGSANPVTNYTDNAAYENPANWTTVDMHDDGLNGDAVAGDSIYSVIVPGSVQTHRRLVRYRVLASDAGESPQSVQTPYADDEQPNFAYFCYNSVPDWTGSLRATADAAGPALPQVTYPGSLLASFPTYHLIALSTDVERCQYQSGFNGGLFYGTMIYDGKIYDHIQFEIRGEFSTYNTGKNKWRFHFNRARDFEGHDNYGQPFAQPRNSFSFDTAAGPWATVNRGMAGLDTVISHRIYQLAGIPSANTNFVHYRVIDSATETNPANQFDTDLWGLYVCVEDYDGDFLEAHGLPDGNIYRLGSGVAYQKHQSPILPGDGSDWSTFSSQSLAAPLPGATYWRANVDLALYYRFHALSRFIGNVDLRGGANHFFYHRDTDNRWLPMPWDLDMMFIAKNHWYTNYDGKAVPGVIQQHRLSDVPELQIELKNAERELLDLMGADASPSGGQIGQLIDEFAQFVNPTGAPLTWADVDAAMWNYHPRTTGTVNSFSGQNNARGHFYYSPWVDSRGVGGPGGNWTRYLRPSPFAGTAEFEDFVRFLTEYTTNTYPPTAPNWVINNTNLPVNSPIVQMGYGYKYLEFEAADTGVPLRPTIAYLGAPGYPVNDLRFQSSAFAPNPAGGTTVAAIQWRLGEVSAPGIPFYDPGEPRVYELEALWNSGELTSFADTIRVPASAVRTGHTYRARVRHKDSNGRWSRWSEASQFVAGDANVATYVDNLVISEVNYHPPDGTPAEGSRDGDDYEFIEVKNVGTEALDLTDVRFTKGIDFDFPAGTMIPAGGFVLVVKDVDAFRARYGNSHDSQIMGEYDPDSLSNTGEEVKLSYGQGEPIREFLYDDAVPWPMAADGDGPSLTLINPDSLPDHTVPANWKASSVTHGTPGADDGGGGMTFATWAASYPGVTDPMVDNDADGLINKLEYAFGGNPLAASSVGTPPTGAIQSLAGVDPPGNYLIATVRKPGGITDLTYTVEFSGNLALWTGDAVLFASTTNLDNSVTEVWRSPDPVTANSRWFVRVKVE